MARPLAIKPMLFSGPMVRALLDGRKTMTRPVLKPQPETRFNTDGEFGQRCGWLWNSGGPGPAGCWHGMESLPTPYAIGDLLDPAMTIPNFPDYCVGISGRLYSRKGGAWKPLALSPTSKGYPGATLCHQGKRRSSHAHILTCEAFHGPRPSKAHQVRHISGDRSDPSAANLCWGTQKENWVDRQAHGNGIEGEKHFASKLTDDERKHLEWGFSKGLFSQRHAALVLGMSQCAIRAACLDGAPKPTIQDAPDHDHFRLTLEVTDVRVERVQDISEEDAKAEGCGWLDTGRSDDNDLLVGDPRAAFARLWDNINAARGFSWQSNPWVAAISFRVHRCNVDTLPPRHATAE